MNRPIMFDIVCFLTRPFVWWKYFITNLTIHFTFDSSCLFITIFLMSIMVIWGIKFPRGGYKIRWIFASKYSKEIICILYLVSDIKPPNHESCFPQFFHEFFSVSGDEIENKLFIGPIKSLFSFSTVPAEQDSWKKLGELKFMVWWSDVTNKIVLSFLFNF